MTGLRTNFPYLLAVSGVVLLTACAANKARDDFRAHLIKLRSAIKVGLTYPELRNFAQELEASFQTHKQYLKEQQTDYDKLTRNNLKKALGRVGARADKIINNL